MKETEITTTRPTLLLVAASIFAVVMAAAMGARALSHEAQLQDQLKDCERQAGAECVWVAVPVVERTE